MPQGYGLVSAVFYDMPIEAISTVKSSRMNTYENNDEDRFSDHRLL